MDFSPFAKAQNDKVKAFCHTERSEVSINLKCILNSLDFLLWLAPCNPLGRLFVKGSK